MEKPKGLTELWYHAFFTHQVFDKHGKSLCNDSFSELRKQYLEAVKKENWIQLSKVVSNLTSIYPISQYYHDIWMKKIYNAQGVALCNVNEKSKKYGKKYRELHRDS